MQRIRGQRSGERVAMECFSASRSQQSEGQTRTEPLWEKEDAAGKMDYGLDDKVFSNYIP